MLMRCRERKEFAHFGLCFKFFLQFEHQILREKTRLNPVFLPTVLCFCLRFQVVLVNKTQCGGLASPGRQCVLVILEHVFPQKWRDGESHQQIQDLAGLLGSHHIHIDGSRVLYCF